MFDSFQAKLGRFLSIFGGFSSPEDIQQARERERMRQRNSSTQAMPDATEVGETEPDHEGGTRPSA